MKFKLWLIHGFSMYWADSDRVVGYSEGIRWIYMLTGICIVIVGRFFAGLYNVSLRSGDITVVGVGNVLVRFQGIP